MTPFDRQVRAQIYRHIVASGLGPSAQQLAEARGWPPEEVSESLARLQRDHLVAVNGTASSVLMAHPFSGVETGYAAIVGDRTWYANCAWDSLAILALMGDGTARMDAEEGVGKWTVKNGIVDPGGVIHMKVPARDFWDDIEFT